MINTLSQETINKIAAGEVVERPLNAVKELVENSLDACATSVTAEIIEAGKKLIRISDNGFGMDKKDLELSVLRHTTSKISDYNDLYHIQSLGFRGEALSSIAAVSDFEIKTRKKGESSGWQISAKGGKKSEISPWAGSEGTITEVKDLFFNTPARKKFLKSDATERAKIIDSLEETALANYDIAFKLTSDKKTVFSAAKVNDKIERISDILGKQFASTLKNISGEHYKVLFDIYFTGRDDSLSNRKYQYFFVNSRPVNFPKWLSHCVYQAYRESIPSDKHPGILIYITIEPSEIDVNIHPTKREIKFSDENAIYDILYKAIRNALTTHSHPSLPVNSPVILKGEALKNPAVSQSHSQKTSTPIYLKEPKARYTPKTYNINQYANVFAKQDELKSDNFDNNIKVLGQTFDTYIIAENDGQLYIFDQHAAAERIRYELYLSQTENKNLRIQQILIPENFELSPSLSDLLQSNLILFNELGITIDEFGKNSFRITAYPALLGNISMEHIVKSILEDIESEKNIEIGQKRDKIIRSACRASIKAGDNVAHIEAKKLVNDLFKCKHPFTCPHGRPTAYKISQNELEKFFKRK
ncbi:MAG: DNA mismatch repair endonuclease MutL [Endomicrobia bacterium]|nr:DNA mismatch repair endonuclease MutL [Endomicrobiia bacterium]MCL2798872.1 DNA mismatch repair endonuclease MutL [Endomicrobiia bacterium]